MTNKRPLTLRHVFWFWVPLATMWLIMSTEQPSITAAVSRLDDPTTNLAAFGLTFAFALIIESPVIMLLTAATALAAHQQAYRRLLRFTHGLALGLTALHLLLALTPLYSFILREWVGAPEPTIETSRIAFLLTTPWTAMIAYRRLWEGVMIRYGHPQRVTLVIVVRLAATVLVLLGGLAWGRWPGAYVGGVALSVAVTVGAATAWALARPTLRDEIREPGPEDEPLVWGDLTRFYAPLALTVLITMVGQPILAFGLSRAPQPLRSLAVWPVMMALVFIGRSFGVAYQEVGVALLRDAQAFAVLRRFAWGLAMAASGGFALLAFTPGTTLWYRYISGLTPELVQLALVPTMVMALVPGLNALISWYRAILVNSKNTSPISLSVGLNMLTLLVFMALFPFLTSLSGALLGALAFTASLTVECAFLWWQTRTAVTRFAPVPVPAD